MAPETGSLQGIYGDHVDVERHAGRNAPTEPVPKPKLGETIELNGAIIRAFPVPGSKLISAGKYASSLWGQTAKITVELPGGETTHYFLKTVSTAIAPAAKAMIKGEFESLRAIQAVCPTLVPTPFAHGEYPSPTVANPDDNTSFLLIAFREISQQPPPPPPSTTPPNPSTDFVTRLSTLHLTSVSPTSQFGFHVPTTLGILPPAPATWSPSWTTYFTSHLRHIIDFDRVKNPPWPEFHAISDLLLEKVVPRLLDPLQDESKGRSIKPCLVHGDLWDENTAVDADTGEAFVFDACSFYAHNEYEVGNWRAKRHRLSGRGYVEGYKRVVGVSEPVEEWDDRNLLYSLRFDLGAAIIIPGSEQRQVVKENMEILCEKFFPDELRVLRAQFSVPN